MDTFENREKSAAGREFVLDIGELFSEIGRNIITILLIGILVGCLALLYCLFMKVPQYESETEIYVLNKSDTSSLTSSDLTVSSSLSKDYAELITSRNVTESVVLKLGLDYSADQLSKLISVASASSDSRILSITITDSDPYRAYEIANTVRDVACEQIETVMSLDAVQVVETANIPEKPVSPNYYLYGGIGVGAGILLAILIVVIRFLFNDTISTADDVNKYLHLSVLGSIPLADYEKKNKKQPKVFRAARSNRKGR